MTQGRRSGGGFTGHPAIVFWLMTDFGRVGNSLQGNLVILDKWVSQLEACLQLKHDFETTFKADLETINDHLLYAWSLYDPQMEAAGFGMNEKELILRMRVIYNYLNLVTAKGHVCDGVRFDDEGDDAP